MDKKKKALQKVEEVKKNPIGDILIDKGSYILLAIAVVLTLGMWYVAITQRNVREVSADPSTAVVHATPTEIPASIYEPRATQEPVSAAAPATVPAVAEEREFSPVMPVMGEVYLGFSEAELVFSRTLKDWRTHLGIDIEGSIGTQIWACDDGVVESVEDDGLYGTVVVIRHEGDILSKYANLQPRPLVSVGQKVGQGDAIGGMGHSAIIEISDPPHLHFEIWVNGKAVDPMRLMR